MMKLVGLMAFGLVAVSWGTIAHAETAEEAACRLNYELCDAKCVLDDPERGLSYAGCSAGCVSSKAACSSKIIYDKSAEWTKEQYEAAKPWVKEKSKQAGELADDVKEEVDKAIENSEQEYPK